MKNLWKAVRVARVLFAVASLFTVALLSGCATIFKGTTDTVHVSIANCGEPISCEASNSQKITRTKSEGGALTAKEYRAKNDPYNRQRKKSQSPGVVENVVRRFTAPGVVSFDKTENPLTITCQDGDKVLRTQVAPQPGGYLWLNLLFFPGFAVDAATDAHWYMPDSVTLHRAYCRGKKTGQ